MKQLWYGAMLGICCLAGAMGAKNLAITYFMVNGKLYFTLDNKNQLYQEDLKPAKKVPSVQGSNATYNLYKLNQTPSNFDRFKDYLKNGYVKISYIENKLGTTSSAQKLLEEDNLELIAKKLNYEKYQQLPEEKIKLEEQVMEELAKMADQLKEEEELERLTREAEKEQLKEDKKLEKELKKLEKKTKKELLKEELKIKQELRRLEKEAKQEDQKK